MKYLAKENIIILLLVVVVFQGILSTPKGISEAEQAYRVRIHDLRQEKALLMQENNNLEIKINSFENEILKNDSIVSGYTTNQLDSAFADYFKR